MPARYNRFSEHLATQYGATASKTHLLCLQPLAIQLDVLQAIAATGLNVLDAPLRTFGLDLTQASDAYKSSHDHWLVTNNYDDGRTDASCATSCVAYKRTSTSRQQFRELGWQGDTCSTGVTNTKATSRNV